MLVDQVSERRASLLQHHAIPEAEINRLISTHDMIQKYSQRPGPTPLGPYYYYTELGNRLDSGGHSTVDGVSQENLDLESILQLLPVPVFVFLDNLDDYYEREPELWYNSIYGQFRAVREIAFTYRHIHIFTSIREDVYNQFADELSLQYFDYVAHLHYTKDEIVNIFKSHLEELDKDLLMNHEARKSDPLAAFFGSYVRIPNDLVDAEEKIEDYLYRHTLGRPRDIIHIGTVLLSNRPDPGFDKVLIRDSVHQAAAHIANQYAAEVRPLLDPRFDLRGFVSGYIDKNCLSRADLSRITEAYLVDKKGSYDPSANSDLTQPFQILIGLGLLGYSRRKLESKRFYQHFKPPGQGLECPENSYLPDADLFFLHPILSSWLRNPTLNDEFVIGPGLPIINTNHGETT